MGNKTISPTEYGLSTQRGFNPLPVVIVAVGLTALGILYHFQIINLWIFCAGVVVVAFLAASVRIADQWEKAVVLRFGRFLGLKGPGLFAVIPIVDRVDKYVDQRVRITDFNAETTLTKDTVPVNVDAVVYWMVWDVEKSALEVQDYEYAIYFVAQTGLRDIIGRHELADLLQNREKIGEELQQILANQTNPWGI